MRRGDKLIYIHNAPSILSHFGDRNANLNDPTSHGFLHCHFLMHSIVRLVSVSSADEAVD